MNDKKEPSLKGWGAFWVKRRSSVTHSRMEAGLGGVVKEGPRARLVRDLEGRLKSMDSILKAPESHRKVSSTKVM